MINYEKAKIAFKKYIEEYDKDDGKIKLKFVHTFGVVNLSEYISKKLGLTEEDIQLTRLIALLHDIGRFDQIKKLKKFADIGILKHAELGVKILFDLGYIRRFIDDKNYDEIIMQAIRRHSQYQIGDGLTEKELLYCKIIRDADKLDNFRVKAVERFEDIAIIKEENLVNGYISDEVFQDFLSCKQILISKRKTDLDFWVSIIAFIFDINFSCSFRYIKEKNFINILIDRINYQNPKTKKQIEQIRNCAIEYIDRALKLIK